MGLIAASVVGACLSLVLSGTGLWAAFLLLRRRTPTASVFPPISVLKPLKGLEDGLLDNLRSIAAQEYPDYELLFGVEEPDDPAAEVARQVQREFPERRIRVVTGAPAVGLNPKVNNLMHLARRARNDWVLISDSNVRAGPDYLRALAAELADPAVGLVHSVLCGQSANTLGGLLENVQMNTVTAYGVSGMEVLSGQPLVVGKSMLFRRSDLEPLGGFLAVANVLAEDYVLGQRFHAAGFRVRLSPHRIAVINAGWSLRRFLARQLRWSQIRRSLVPGTYCLEPLMSTMLWAGVLFAAGLAGPAPVRFPCAVLAAALLALRLAFDSAQVALLRGRGLTWLELLCLPLKDLLMLGLWVLAMGKRTVDWRGTQVRIGAGSVLRAPRAALHDRDVRQPA